jgi:hypothetical protein
MLDYFSAQASFLTPSHTVLGFEAESGKMAAGNELLLKQLSLVMGFPVTEDGEGLQDGTLARYSSTPCVGVGVGVKVSQASLVSMSLYGIGTKALACPLSRLSGAVSDAMFLGNGDLRIPLTLTGPPSRLSGALTPSSFTH